MSEHAASRLVDAALPPIAVVATQTDQRPAARSPVNETRWVGHILHWGTALLALIVVGFMTFGLWLSGLDHARRQLGLERRFRSELTSATAPIGGTIGEGDPVAILDVARIGTHEVVVEGARAGELRDGPGHVVGSSLPGQPGNAVIAGRRSFYGAPFARISSLRRGDRIETTTGQGTSVYRVTGVKTLDASDGSIFLDHGDNRITLFTGDPELFANRRLVVSAQLRGTAFAATRLRRSLDAEGLGLTGEHSAGAVVLVWLEILLAVVLLAAVAQVRWSRVAAWVVFVPSTAALAWLVFENAVRLLPATL